jgi:hypothetical protein
MGIMERNTEISGSLFGVPTSRTDANRLYSILLDARASSVSENMYDIADRLLSSEKENAKVVLEHLWALKNNMQGQTDTGTVDLLIEFYQNKMDVVRNREERIKKIGKDSRTLLEEKRKRDAELATIKQEIQDCSTEIETLTQKLQKLKVKEQELSLIEQQVGKELMSNSNEVINGLYEIILPVQEADAAQEAQEAAEPRGAIIPESASEEPDEPGGDTAQGENAVEHREETDAPDEQRTPAAREGESIAGLENEEAAPAELSEERDGAQLSAGATVQLNYMPDVTPPPTPSYPKSVVKTTKGRVIGEYYYDPKAYRNRRQYVYSSMFFARCFGGVLRRLQKQVDQNAVAEAMQIVQDVYKRVKENGSIHLEVSTNEILNERNLKDLLIGLKARRFEEAARFAGRLQAKVDALGVNYVTLLDEQMARLGAQEG